MFAFTTRALKDDKMCASLRLAQFCHNIMQEEQMKTKVLDQPPSYLASMPKILFDYTKSNGGGGSPVARRDNEEVKDALEETLEKNLGLSNTALKNKIKLCV